MAGNDATFTLMGDPFWAGAKADIPGQAYPRATVEMVIRGGEGSELGVHDPACR